MWIAYLTVVGMLVAAAAVVFFRAAYLYHPADTKGSSNYILALAVPAVLVLVAGLAFGMDLRTSALLGLLTAAPFFLCVIAAAPIAAAGFLMSYGRTWHQKVLFALGTLTALAIVWVILFAHMH